MTAPENIILRKLDWYRLGGETSDRQWRDVLGVLKLQVDEIDRGYLEDIAMQSGLGHLTARALSEAGM